MLADSTAVQTFWRKIFILRLSPYLFLLSILVEQQEGKQGWLPLPLVCRTADRAFGVSDRLPRAGARHGAHCGRHRAAQARGPPLPCLLRLGFHVLKEPSWAAFPLTGDSEFNPNISEEEDSNRSWTCRFSVLTDSQFPLACPPHDQVRGVEEVLLIKNHFMYLSFYYKVSIKQALPSGVPL